MSAGSYHAWLMEPGDPVGRLAAAFEKPDVDPREIDLDRVVEVVSARLMGVRCSVEQTGGGCAAVQLGDTYTLQGSDCIPVLAGPGWFNGPHWTEGLGHRDDFSVGYDCNDPEVADDPGDSNWEVEGPVEAHIADVMVQRYREHPRIKRGEIR